MIYTLTLNPSVDYIVKLGSFKLGELNRTNNEAKFPGGKGINVSRVLKQMGTESEALGFVGGFTGTYIEQFLHEENIETDFVRVEEDTRINIKLKTAKETEINAGGPAISEADFQLLIEKIKKLGKTDLIVLAGSIPTSLPVGTYEELVKICRENGTQFVVDAEGDLLKKVIPFQPFLIKPNHHELGDLFQVSISTPEEVIPYGKELINMGAQNVIVSLADKGAVFLNKEMILYAKVPKGQVKNSVGAGDSMVAGFLAAYSQTKDWLEAFKFSVASGSATAFSLGLCTKEKALDVMKQVEITEIG
ncbi:1-phosphofructokinase [Neobacillus mesonae]|uniref:1-phosphofructokinase n=1 Tax=Neobacillus mesonae TaxID=1193713 RepID=UPI0020411075|nr:1-phosphofructokinase [Neobacillus mesonae]MCM3568852.1 1-phosphofructokinase [Neobacillus mesonae]